MIRIKICGLTRAEDARAAVALGADALGWIFAPSPRRVTPARARAMIRELPPHVLRVGVFANQPLDWVCRVAGRLGLDRIQLHGDETDAELRRLAGHRVIKALRPKPGERPPRRAPFPSAAAYVVDAYVPGQAGGTGQIGNWAFARSLRRFGQPVILSGGLTAANVRGAVARVRPDMIDVSSGVEQRPGVKSPAKLRAFILAARGAAR